MKLRSILDAVSRKESLSAEAKKSLARSYHYTGLAWSALGNASAALKEYEQAVALRERLANPQAGDTGFTRELADDYRSIYFLHRDAGQHQQCQNWCERAATTFGRLAQDYPETMEFANVLDEMQIRRVISVGRSGRHKVASHDARALLENRTLTPYNLYNLACVFALSVTQARGDSSLTVQQKEQLAQSYMAEAIRLLVKSGAAANLTDLKNDPDLQGILSSVEFQRLVTSLELRSGDGGQGNGGTGR